MSKKLKQKTKTTKLMLKAPSRNFWTQTDGKTLLLYSLFMLAKVLQSIVPTMYSSSGKSVFSFIYLTSFSSRK